MFVPAKWNGVWCKSINYRHCTAPWLYRCSWLWRKNATDYSWAKLNASKNVTFRPIWNQSFPRCIYASAFSTVWFPWVGCPSNFSTDPLWQRILSQTSIWFPATKLKWNQTQSCEFRWIYFMFRSMHHWVAATANYFQQFIIVQPWHRHFQSSLRIYLECEQADEFAYCFVLVTATRHFQLTCRDTNVTSTLKYGEDVEWKRGAIRSIYSNLQW